MNGRTRRWLGAGATIAAAAAVSMPTGVAALSSAGAGEVGLIVDFASPGVQPPPVLCAAVSFSFRGGSQVAAITIPGTQAYVGPVALNGSGGSACAGVPFDSGSVSLTATGSSGISVGAVNCSFGGIYVRLASAVVVQLTGPCTLGGVAEPTAGLVIVGVFRPTVGNGVTSPVTQASFNGAFALQG